MVQHNNSETSQDTWLSFWQEKNAFDDLMIVNFEFSLRNIEKYISPGSNDVVLDFGSGPGLLEDAWHSRVKEIHGLDVSRRYNDLVRERHSNHANVHIHDLDPNHYTDLSMVGNNKFTIIIVLSVLQYYKSKEEIITLLRNLKAVAAPDGKFLLCDLMVQSSFLKEIVEVLTDAVKAGKLLSTLALFFKLRFSKYYRVKKQSGFLVLTKEEWDQIFADLQLNATYIHEPITLQRNRKNVFIQF